MVLALSKEKIVATTVPYSIVQFFQSRVAALTGIELSLLNSPRKGLELSKAKQLYQRCGDDLMLVMRVINSALREKYVLDNPSLAVIHSKVEQLLFALRRQKKEPSGYLDRSSVVDSMSGRYLEREREIVL